jgi:translation elongation factor EF-G
MGVKFVFDINEGTCSQSEIVWEQGAEENILRHEKYTDRTLEKTE